jgi:methylaspartate mutase sigma subunit
MDQPNQALAPGVRSCVVSSMSSDSHTWNLIFLQLLLEETGYDVTNLGACVPDEVLVDRCRAAKPDLLVLSSVNGHGFHDGLRVVRQLREQPDLDDLPILIGGKLGISGLDEARARELLDAGFDAVYQDRPADIGAMRSFAAALVPGGAR